MKFLLLIIYLFSQSFNNQKIMNEAQDINEVIVDCSYVFEEAIKGIEIPKSILNQLKLIEVEYYSFDEKLHKGQLVVNKKVSKEIKEIFEFIKTSRFPIAKVIPIVRYNWNDEASMNDNNTAAFNYRSVKGFKVLSKHSYGLAIDINPLQNPHVRGKVSQPVNGRYDTNCKGTILRDSKLVKVFVKRGWKWGGSWKSSKDYQHFEKVN